MTKSNLYLIADHVDTTSGSQIPKSDGLVLAPTDDISYHHCIKDTHLNEDSNDNMRMILTKL